MFMPMRQLVVNGTLQVNGLKDTIDRVYFQWRQAG